MYYRLAEPVSNRAIDSEQNDVQQCWQQRPTSSSAI